MRRRGADGAAAASVPLAAWAQQPAIGYFDFATPGYAPPRLIFTTDEVIE